MVQEPRRVDGKLSWQRVQAPGGWPIFKGKGASTRKLVRYALRLATEFNSGSEHDLLRLGVAQTLSRMYDIMYEESRFLSASAKTELAELSVVFMGMYHRLSAEAYGKSIRAWKMRPKFHVTQHILEHQTWINPKMAWTYADEDLQRLLKGIARSCHPANLPHMVLHKWVCSKFGDSE